MDFCTKPNFSYYLLSSTFSTDAWYFYYIYIDFLKYLHKFHVLINMLYLFLCIKIVHVKINMYTYSLEL